MNNCRIQAAHLAAAAIGQVIFMAAAARRSSIWMSAGAGGDVVCVMETGTNCGRLAALCAGKVVGLGGDITALSRSRARLLQPCTMFAFKPCDIATFATDSPGAAHCSSTNAFNSALCRRRKTTFSAAIVATCQLEGHAHLRHAPAIQGAAARRLPCTCLWLTLFTQMI